MTRNLSVAVLIILVGSIFVPVVRAQLVSAKVDTTVALDPETRNLLLKFSPEAAKIQALDLLDKALPKLKTSLDAFLTDMNEAVQKALDAGQCSGDGLSAEFSSQFVGRVTTIRGPIETINKEAKRLEGTLTRTSGPEDYSAVYGDLYHASAVMYCQMKISGAVHHAAEYEDEYMQLDSDWSRLRGHCKNASDCLTVARAGTLTLIDKSDARDVQLVKAREKWDSVSKPPDPDIWDRLTKDFDYMPYQQAIRTLFSIQQQVTLAKLQREYTAVDAINQAQGQLTEADGLIASGQAALTPVPAGFCQRGVLPPQAQKANQYGSQANEKLTGAEAAIAKAASLDAANQSQAVKNLRSQLKERLASSAGLATAKAYTAFIPGCSGHVNQSF